MRRLVLAVSAACIVVISGCALHPGAVAGPKKPPPTRRVKVEFRPRHRVGAVENPVMPPAPRVEIRTARPARDVVWAPGHWKRGAGSWIWVPGHWKSKPAKDVEWVPRHWENRAETSETDRWVWVRGYWKKTRRHRVHRSDDGD